jgi:hypothetical protein
MSHIIPLTADEVERRLLKIADLTVYTAIQSGTDIQVTLKHFIEGGSEVKFRAPVDCSEVTRLVVKYKTNNGDTASKKFAFADANGNDVGEVNNLFAKDSIVKVILDLDSKIEGVDGAAFIQNADTNAYLEDCFNNINEAISEVATSLNTELTDVRESMSELETAFDSKLADVQQNITDMEAAIESNVAAIEESLNASIDSVSTEVTNLRTEVNNTISGVTAVQIITWEEND